MATINLRETAARHRRLLRALGEDTRQMREDAGLSQSAVARAAGIAQSHLSEIEAGTTEPGLAVLGRIGAVLGVDLSIRYFANAGPRVRDRLQLPMVEAILEIAHPRYRREVEVGVWRPARGVIDLVLHDQTQPVSVASEVHSHIRRAEQQIRWAKEKADALAATPEMQGRRVHRLLVLRNTASTRELLRAAPATFAAEYPGKAIEAYAALIGEEPVFPEAAILWVTLDGGRARVLEAPPRGVRVGR
jgi:transcriptional regulator with XRE-family HTH domain